MTAELPCYFNIIIALGPNGEFGNSKENKLPWDSIPEDFKHFKTVTTSNSSVPNIIIMGRNTFESIGKPLPNRINFVITSKLLDHESRYPKFDPDLHNEHDEKSDEKSDEKNGKNGSEKDQTKNFPNESGTVSSLLKTNLFMFTSFDSALHEAGQMVLHKRAKNIFVIGGKKVLDRAFASEYLEYIHITRVYDTIGTIQADIIIDFKSSSYNLHNEHAQDCQNGRYQLLFQTFSPKKSHNQENKYLNILENVISSGKNKSNRTGIDTLYIPGASLEFRLDLVDEKLRYPLFTTKRVFHRGVVHELLFFISGKTQTKVLETVGVNIWKGNTSREFLDKSKHSFVRALQEGDMGNGYGFQWRHFGAVRKPNEQLEIGTGGIDQLQQVIDNIMTVMKNPTDEVARRLIMTAWNPLDLDKMVLPPCHMMVQFLVDHTNISKDDSLKPIKLHCCVTMRSCDLGLGLPFNVASYSLLTFMICKVINLQLNQSIKLIPGNIRYNLEDTHIYINHLDSLKIMLQRPPRKWPLLEINGEHKSINDFIPNNFILRNYYPHPELKMDMAV